FDPALARVRFFRAVELLPSLLPVPSRVLDVVARGAVLPPPLNDACHSPLLSCRWAEATEAPPPTFPSGSGSGACFLLCFAQLLPEFVLKDDQVVLHVPEPRQELVPRGVQPREIGGRGR